MKKSYWIAVTVFGFALLLVPLVGIILLGGWNNLGWGMMDGWPSGMMHGWGFGSFGWFGIILMWLSPIVFIVLVVLGIVGLVRGLASDGVKELALYQKEEIQPSPREILQIRYTLGEITREQYLQMLDDMS